MYSNIVFKFKYKFFESGRKDVLDKEGFKNALYIFDIGQNDLTVALTFNPLPYDQVLEKIPSFISGIKDAIQVRNVVNCKLILHLSRIAVLIEFGINFKTD